MNSISGMVLAAGAGTRIRPLSLERPKALMPVLDVTALSSVLASFAVAGIRDCTVNANLFPDEITAEMMTTSTRLGIDWKVSIEKGTRLGTAGALLAAKDDLKGTFLLANADILSDVDVSAALQAHTSSGARGTVVVIEDSTCCDLEADEGRVVRWTPPQERSRAGLRYAGIGIFDKTVLSMIPDGVSGLFETVLSNLAASSDGLFVYQHRGYWRDLGTPASYLQANLDALARKIDLTDVLARLGVAPIEWSDTRYLGPGCLCPGETSMSVIGRGAEIDPATHLYRCVVWDGATVGAGDHRESIITETTTLKTSLF